MTDRQPFVIPPGEPPSTGSKAWSQETVDRLLEFVAGGMPVRQAAYATGLDPARVYEWIRESESARHHSGPLQVRGFSDAIEAAKAWALVPSLRKVQEATDWRSGAWMLERLAPETFSTKVEISHSGQVGLQAVGLLDSMLEGLTDEQLKALTKIKDEEQGADPA